MNSVKVSCLPAAPALDRQEKILLLIGEVEVAKMLNPKLTPQERRALMLLLSDTGLPLTELARVGQRVIEKTTYGNIAFEHWKSEMDFSGINNALPYSEPDRYCVECDANHKWNEMCPKLFPESCPVKVA